MPSTTILRLSALALPDGPGEVAFRSATMRKANYILEIICVVVSLSVTMALIPTYATAKPKPSENGLEYCVLRDVGGDPDEETEVNWEDRSCCFWEDQGNGEAIHLCLECDANWKNCEEVMASRPPGMSTMPGSGEAAPLPGQTGTGARTPGKRPNLQFKLQRRSD